MNLSKLSLTIQDPHGYEMPNAISVGDERRAAPLIATYQQVHHLPCSSGIKGDTAGATTLTTAYA